MLQIVREKRLLLKKTAIFYFIACSISWPFFWVRDRSPEILTSATLKTLAQFLMMWGPGISALFCFVIFRKTHKRTITFQRRQLFLRGALFYITPFAIAALINRDLHFFQYAALSFIYILGEELGWRGFLQDALRPISTVKRFLIIGVLWEFWHFTTRTSIGTPFQILLRLCISYPCVILLAFILGVVTERFRSLWIPLALHAFVDFVLMDSPEHAILIIPIALGIWAGMLWLWPKYLDELSTSGIPKN